MKTYAETLNLKRHKGTVSSFAAQPTDHYSTSKELFYPQRVMLAIKNTQNQNNHVYITRVSDSQCLGPGVLKSNPSITRKKHIIFLSRKTRKILHVKTVVTRHSTQGTHTKTSVFKLHPISVHLFGLISRKKDSIDENEFFFF